MKRGKRKLSYILCRDCDCIYNNDAVCNSRINPHINLLEDGTFKCITREEKPEVVELTTDEKDYLYHLLSRRHFEINPSTCHNDRGEDALIWKLKEKVMRIRSVL